jgi:hypothetical protein
VFAPYINGGAIQISWSFDRILMDAVGTTFIVRPFQYLVSGAITHGVELLGIDPHGTFSAGGSPQVQANQAQLYTPIVFGDRHYAVQTQAYRNFYIENLVLSDAGDALNCQAAGTDTIAAFTGSPSGDVFVRYSGAPGTPPVIPACQFGAPPYVGPTGNFVAKVSGGGYSKQLPDTTSLMMGGNSGDLFLGGLVQPGEDLGCSPLNSPGASYLARLGANGQCLWSRLSQGMIPVGPTTNGDLVLTNANFQGTVDLGCGPITSGVNGSTLLARFDASGACVWNKTIDVPGLNAWLFPDGEMLVGLDFAGTVDLGGGPLTSVGVIDVAIARLDSSGTHLWSKRFGGPGVSLSPRVWANANGSVVLTGGLTGWVDFGGGALGSMADQAYVVKLADDGAFLWQHQLPSGTNILSDPCGGAVYATPGTIASGPWTGMNNVTVTKLAP